MDGTARLSAPRVGVYTEGGEARAAPGEPFFSIVIPMFNRQAFIGRALRSCLAQEISDWEAVVVDDASTDRSAEVVAGIDDPRVRLIRHEQNLGVCPARNSGVRAARGKWIVFLDSDDELMPGALRAMNDAVGHAGDDIHRLIFSIVLDDGTISPQPPLSSGAIWEYRDYIEWLARTGSRTDFVNCIRREVFDSLSWPENRALEALFHFEMARRFRTQCHDDVAAIVHDDAPNRSGAAGAEHRLRVAADMSDATSELLEVHGRALRRWAPRALATFLRSAAVNSFLAGKRARGVRYALALLRCEPFAPSSWATLALASLGRGGVAGAMALRSRMIGRSKP